MRQLTAMVLSMFLAFGAASAWATDDLSNDNTDKKVMDEGSRSGDATYGDGASGNPRQGTSTDQQSGKKADKDGMSQEELESRDQSD